MASTLNKAATVDQFTSIAAARKQLNAIGAVHSCSTHNLCQVCRWQGQRVKTNTKAVAPLITQLEESYSKADSEKICVGTCPGVHVK